MVRAHNGILFGNKKERSTDICCIKEESQTYYAKSNTPDAKDQVLYDSIDMECPEKANI